MLGYPPTPPPPPRGAQRLTARLADPQGSGQPRGGEGSPPSPLQPPKRLHTPRGHTLAGGSPCEVRAMPTCTTRRDGVHGAHAHGSAGMQVTDDLDDTRRGRAIGPRAHRNMARDVVNN